MQNGIFAIKNSGQYIQSNRTNTSMCRSIRLYIIYPTYLHCREVPKRMYIFDKSTQNIFLTKIYVLLERKRKYIYSTNGKSKACVLQGVVKCLQTIFIYKYIFFLSEKILS